MNIETINLQVKCSKISFTLGMMIQRIITYAELLPESNKDYLLNIIKDDIEIFEKQIDKLFYTTE